MKAYAKDGWFLVRASNTKPEIKIRAESKSKEVLKELLDELQISIMEASSRLGIKVDLNKLKELSKGGSQNSSRSIEPKESCY